MKRTFLLLTIFIAVIVSYNFYPLKPNDTLCKECLRIIYQGQPVGNGLIKIYDSRGNEVGACDPTLGNCQAVSGPGCTVQLTSGETYTVKAVHWVGAQEYSGQTTFNACQGVVDIVVQ